MLADSRAEREAAKIRTGTISTKVLQQWVPELMEPQIRGPFFRLLTRLISPLLSGSLRNSFFIFAHFFFTLLNCFLHSSANAVLVLSVRSRDVLIIINYQLSL